MAKLLGGIAGIIVVFTVLGFTLNSLGLFGGTIVERKVFEQSYQRSEALRSQISQDKAVLAEIDMLLSNPNLTEPELFSLKAQAAAAKVRIATAEGKQN